MRKFPAVVALYMASVCLAQAAPKDICPTLAQGRWIIVSAHPVAPIVAMLDAQANRFVGREIAISGDKVVYDGRSCRVSKSHIERPNDDYFDTTDHPRDSRDYPYDVVYKCPADKAWFMPTISLGKSCEKAMYGLDGWAFVLRKKH